MATVLVTYLTEADDPLRNIRIVTDEVNGANLSEAWAAVARYFDVPHKEVSAKYDGSEFYIAGEVVARLRQVTLQMAFDTAAH